MNSEVLVQALKAHARVTAEAILIAAKFNPPDDDAAGVAFQLADRRFSEAENMATRDMGG